MVNRIYCLPLFSLRGILKDIVGISLVPLTLAFFYYDYCLVTNFCKQMDEGQRLFLSKPEVKKLLTLYSLCYCKGA